MSLAEVLARRTFERPVRALMDEDITDALAAAHKAPTQPAVVAVAAHQAAPAVAAAVQPPTGGEATRQQEHRRQEARPAVPPAAGIDVTV